jgi:hypothetical protein
MKQKKIASIFISFFLGLILLNGIIISGDGMDLIFPPSHDISVSNGNDTPTQEELFNGHTFDENYWNINVFNNSKWASEQVQNWTSWENNTWNLVWVKEGGFEMGMVSFMNKTRLEGGKNVTYTSPTHLWWQHFSIKGIEIAIASMQCAWFGIEDTDMDGEYDDGEGINPFFYFGSNSPNITDTVGLDSNPEAQAIDLQRSTHGHNIIYEWGYNYTDIVFYVPSINSTPAFDEGWVYSNPNTYINGSDLIGNQTYLAYEYRLEIDTKNSLLTFTQGYESGEIDTLMYHNDSTYTWEEVKDGDPAYMPDNWMLCLGTTTFVLVGVETDYGITSLDGRELNSTTHESGLSEVDINVGNGNDTAFEFLYDQNPQYDLWNLSGNSMGDTNVTYETLDTSDAEFIDFVGGLLHILGNFSRMVLSYAGNQTHNFNYPLPIEDIYKGLDPTQGDLAAAFFIEGFPEYGLSGGGRLNHSTMFKAYFPSQLIPLLPILPAEVEEIPGFNFELILCSLGIGIIIIFTFKNRDLNFLRR